MLLHLLLRLIPVVRNNRGHGLNSNRVLSVLLKLIPGGVSTVSRYKSNRAMANAAVALADDVECARMIVSTGTGVSIGLVAAHRSVPFGRPPFDRLIRAAWYHLVESA